MKTIVYSGIHIIDQAHANSINDDLVDWHERARAAFRDPPDTLLVERGPRHDFFPIISPILFAGIPDSKPYHCKDWSYGVACGQAALSYVMQHEFDLCVGLTTDAILGVSLQAIAEEFMTRPEVIGGPLWHGSLDTHLVLMKRPAIIDILYSLPFMPLGQNALYYEHALGMLFDRRWWNPWPEVRTIRHEYGTPEQFRGPDDDIMHWPMLAKTSPAVAERYRKEHPIERMTL